MAARRARSRTASHPNPCAGTASPAAIHRSCACYLGRRAMRKKTWGKDNRQPMISWRRRTLRHWLSSFQAAIVPRDDSRCFKVYWTRCFSILDDNFHVIELEHQSIVRLVFESRLWRKHVRF
ncbi:hypothetical protein FH972_026598 [Carpinus fangiana]|uniref:Uncharacterized protein n=1 Tax=Carpinus fangiana TaxID=176857 RepID=A0A5N6L4V0_9ROSI|nr:hypothetical protein FH972_026598 [Carpinus fangiana]